MNCQSHRRLGTAVVIAAGLFSFGCDMQPTDAPREYKLSESVIEELESFPFGAREQGQLLGSLEMLFGTPEAPGYLSTSEWLDEGFNPNYPWYAADDNGSGSLTEKDKEQIRAGNAVRFAPVIELLEAGQVDQVADQLAKMPRGGFIGEWWENELQFAPEDGSAEELTEFAAAEIDRFLDYYPSLAASAELYRLQCLHCHGNEGGADGPTANFLDPLPRDYRRGIFKYTALKDKARPRRIDLYNTLAEGVYSTAMPNFRRFTDAELHGLVDYVQLLAMRGETEMLLGATMVSDEGMNTEMVLEIYGDVFERWSGMDERLITFDGPIPEPTPELLARGAELFNDANRGNCFSCHGDASYDKKTGISSGGRGNGISAWQPVTDDEGNPIVDEDGKPLISAWTGLPRIEPLYLDDWGNKIVPRNLAEGVFRFGKRPIDIYRRIYAGINGTPMPAIGESKDADGNPLLSDDDMWALVHFVRSLSEKQHGEGLMPQRLVKHDETASDHAAHAPAEHGEESTH